MLLLPKLKAPQPLFVLRTTSDDSWILHGAKPKALTRPTLLDPMPCSTVPGYDRRKRCSSRTPNHIIQLENKFALLTFPVANEEPQSFSSPSPVPKTEHSQLPAQTRCSILLFTPASFSAPAHHLRPLIHSTDAKNVSSTNSSKPQDPARKLKSATISSPNTHNQGHILDLVCST